MRARWAHMSRKVRKKRRAHRHVRQMGKNGQKWAKMCKNGPKMGQKWATSRQIMAVFHKKGQLG